MSVVISRRAYGIRRLSELEIDADVSWHNHSISDMKMITMSGTGEVGLLIDRQDLINNPHIFIRTTPDERLIMLTEWDMPGCIALSTQQNVAKLLVGASGIFPEDSSPRDAPYIYLHYRGEDENTPRIELHGYGAEENFTTMRMIGKPDKVLITMFSGYLSDWHSGGILEFSSDIKLKIPKTVSSDIPTMDNGEIRIWKRTSDTTYWLLWKEDDVIRGVQFGEIS